mgnify:CR=1 FL=1
MDAPTAFEATEAPFGEAGVVGTAPDLPPNLWDAVRSAVRNTRYPRAPAFYDAGYWCEEREAIARLAVCEAVQRYRGSGRVSLEYFAQQCAVQAIHQEWRRQPGGGLDSDSRDKAGAQATLRRERSSLLATVRFGGGIIFVVWDAYQPEVLAVVERALTEDIGALDWTTTALIPDEMVTECAILAQAEGILCGIAVAQTVFRRLDPAIEFLETLPDGARLTLDCTVLRLRGNTRAILTAERTALNFLQHLSGIATFTHRFVQAVEGTGAQITDTRKTTPGLRALEKYAVRVGGGRNHRMGLYDGILIKDNHLLALQGDVREAVRCARAHAPHTLSVEVECTTLEQVEQAIQAGADAILLDNMPLAQLRQAVRLARGRVRFIEASGGVCLETVRAIAETGVDLIAVGAITHSAPILPMHLEF